MRYEAGDLLIHGSFFLFGSLIDFRLCRLLFTCTMVGRWNVKHLYGGAKILRFYGDWKDGIEGGWTDGGGMVV